MKTKYKRKRYRSFPAAWKRMHEVRDEILALRQEERDISADLGRLDTSPREME